MAYRDLVQGDKVKVKPLDVTHSYAYFSNCFGKVLSTTRGGKAVVEFSSGRMSTRAWFYQDQLMVANDDLSGSIYRFRHSEPEIDENECPYADWDHEDLVEKIKDLERLYNCLLEKSLKA